MNIQRLPFISAELFNKNIYSFIPDFYKKTIIGNIFAFSDYFLKGFTYGFFFPLEFVKNWNKLPENKRKLNSQLVNKNLIFTKNLAKKIGKSKLYQPLTELIDLSESLKYFDSNIYIDLSMDSIGTSGDFLFPKAELIFNHDLDVHIDIRKKMKEENEEYLNYYNNFQSALYRMHGIYNTLMYQIPEFHGFLFVLKLITFAFHINFNLGSIGKMINTENAFQVKNVGENYVEPFPDVFPPWPRVKRIQVSVNFTRWEIIETFHNTCINQEIKRIINDEKDDFTKNGLLELCKKIEELYKQKVKAILGEYSNLFDDEDIRMNEFHNKSIMIVKEIHTLMKKKLEKLLFEIEKNLNKDKQSKKNKRNEFKTND